MTVRARSRSSVRSLSASSTSSSGEGGAMPCGTPPECAAAEAEQKTADHYDAIHGDPAALASFLTAMPKGGDLHNHLTGAVYAETYLSFAKMDGDCVNPTTHQVVFPSSCSATNACRRTSVDQVGRPRAKRAAATKTTPAKAAPGPPHVPKTKRPAAPRKLPVSLVTAALDRAIEAAEKAPPKAAPGLPDRLAELYALRSNLSAVLSLYDRRKLPTPPITDLLRALRRAPNDPWAWTLYAFRIAAADKLKLKKSRLKPYLIRAVFPSPNPEDLGVRWRGETLYVRASSYSCTRFTNHPIIVFLQRRPKAVKVKAYYLFAG